MARRWLPDGSDVLQTQGQKQRVVEGHLDTNELCEVATKQLGSLPTLIS